MSNYRRFVSYIYAYRNGKKEQNTGFAKVESRNGTLKIGIQVTGIREQESLDAYLFVRKDEKLLGIFLGAVTVAGIVGELSVSTDSRDIEGSGYSLEEIAGLWIQGEGGNHYITLWDEEPLKKLELEILRKEGDGEEPEGGNPPEGGWEEPEGGNPPEGGWEEPEGGNPPEERWEEPKEGNSPEEQWEEPEERNPLGEEWEEPEEGNPRKEGREEPEERNPTEEEWGKPEEGNPPEGGREEPEEGNPPEGGREELEEGNPPEGQWEEPGNRDLSEEQAENTKVMEGNTADLSGKPLESGAQATLNGVRAQENHFSGDEPSWMTRHWMMLSRTYAHVQPFRNSQVVDCLRISPRELGIFCQKDPAIGRNTFLLHGYYHFRHLLLIRCEDNSYRLAVPGYYSLQEQRTAVFYGFPYFMENREQRGRVKQGYWCRPIE